MPDPNIEAHDIREKLGHIDQMLADIDRTLADSDRKRQKIRFAPGSSLSPAWQAAPPCSLPAPSFSGCCNKVQAPTPLI